MSKTVFRPFWSYDIIKTENWLSSMHLQGYVLGKVDFNKRLFYFNQSDPGMYYYRIVYEKSSDGNIPQSLYDNGYVEVCSSKNYYIISTAEQNSKLSPSYIGILDKNHRLKYLSGIALLSILLCFGLPLSLLLIIFTSLTSEEVTPESIPEEAKIPPSEVMGLILFTLFRIATLIILVWLIYTYFKLRETNKTLETRCGDNQNPFYPINYNNDGENTVNSGSIIRKLKLGWFYSPDKTEAWLEKMESEGFNLYRMNKQGNTFYFSEGKPRKIKYSIDYQIKAGQEYYNMNTESGWKLIFKSPFKMDSINIWSKEYKDIVPVFYSDNESILKHAKRLAVTYSSIFIIMFATFIINFIEASSLLDSMNFFAIFYLITILVPIFFSIKTVSYYLRIKRSVKTL